MVTLHDVLQGSPEWLAARENMYTGSNAYKLLTSFGAGDHAKAVHSEFKGNFHTMRGHLLEDEAIELYEAITNTKVSHIGYITNDFYNNCLYSPDGFTDSHLIEVKCFSEKPHMELWNAKSTLEIPLKILAQIYYGMMITEKRKARLVIYNPRLEAKKAFKITDIDYEPLINKRLTKILTEV